MRRAQSRIVQSGLALALVACGGAPPVSDASAASSGNSFESSSGGSSDERPQQPIGREPSSSENQIFEGIASSASRVRALPVLRPVRTRIATGAEIRGYFADEFARERTSMRESAAIYRTLGLLPAGYDLESSMSDLVQEQVVGFYDDRNQLMVVRDDIARGLAGGQGADSMSNGTLLHEYVHALQDQQLNLSALHHGQTRNTDQENAFSALVEGDATFAMLISMLSGMGVSADALVSSRISQMLPSLMQQATADQPSLRDAPAIVRVSLISRYLDGLAFISALYRQGSFAAVNAAYERLPASSEQILHPEKYLAAEGFHRFEFPALPSIESMGFLPVGDLDTLGELESSVFFARGTNSDRNAQAAAGWDGDNLRVWIHPDGRTCAVWLMRFDTPRDAEQAARELSRIGSLDSTLVHHREGRSIAALFNVDPSVRTQTLSALRPTLETRATEQ